MIVRPYFLAGEIHMEGPPTLKGRTSGIVWIAVVISGILVLFFLENIWIGPHLHRNHRRIPSFVPEAQSTEWFVIFSVLAIAVLLLLVCLILLLKDRNTSPAIKVCLTVAAVLVLLMSVDWIRVTNGMPEMLTRTAVKKSHKVLLTWQASPSHVAGYNIYRKNGQLLPYQKLNTAPVDGLTFTDDTVESGVTYYYVTRSVDSHGDESGDSNVFTVSVP
jgi:hypothetical protein